MEGSPNGVSKLEILSFIVLDVLVCYIIPGEQGRSQVVNPQDVKSDGKR